MIAEPLELKHRELLEPRFRRLELDISEYSFANAYLFRREHQFQVIRSKDIYLKGKTRDGFWYLMPTTSIEDWNWADLEYCLQECNFLFPIPETWQKYFDERRYKPSRQDSESDYLYTVHKLADFPGRHLSSRRNLLRQFLDLFPEHQSMALDLSHQEDAMLILETWQKSLGVSGDLTDYAACHEALELMDRLHLTGHITYVAGKPAGFILGEELSKKSFVIHFAKALREYKGIYQYIYQEFARFLDGKYEYINLEQDLGDADLQQSKRAYDPDQLIPKLRMSLWKSTAS